MIQCPNPTCRASNPIDRSACQTCHSPLNRRYLWATGEALASSEQAVGKNHLIAQRFQVIGGNLLLDTRPGERPPALEVLPASVIPYLRLSYLGGQVPRPFAFLAPANSGLAAPLLLLENPPIRESDTAVDLLPTLESQWSEGSPLRQVGWLWHVARLWSPCLREGVAQSLLQPHWLRVDGPLVRLLALGDPQPQGAETLVQLGLAWKALVSLADARAQPFLEALVQHLISGKIDTAKHLVGQLEQGMIQLAASQSVVVDLATASDQGPTRQRNEDACYPPSGSELTVEIPTGDQPQPLVVVCDGIGGHEGGDVASQLAIAQITEHLAPILQQPQLTSHQIIPYLRQAIRVANDAIAARNDQEQRQARGRMGTTLVVALVHAPFLYLAHLGDSRAYRVTTHNCSQVTLDDDVASRESRLGYALYRDALQSANSGSLVQALGISKSDHLMCNIQRFLLNDDSVYLLCSDGLSDFDRVEGMWRSVVRPVLQDQISVPAMTRQLITLANAYNGHDNVTVGVLKLRSQPPQPFPTLAPQLFPVPAAAVSTVHLDPPSPGAPPPPPGPTRLVSSPPVPGGRRRSARRRSPWAGLGLMTVAIALISGSFSWWAMQTQSAPRPLDPLRIPPLAQGSTLQSLTLGPPPAVAIGSYWQVTLATPTVMQPTPGASARGEGAAGAASLPAGSILKVTRRQAISDPSTAKPGEWVQLQICSTPAGTALIPPPQEADSMPNAAAASDPPRQLWLPGEAGWLRLRQLPAVATPLPSPTATQRGVCP